MNVHDRSADRQRQRFHRLTVGNTYSKEHPPIFEFLNKIQIHKK